METIKKFLGQINKPIEADFFKHFWEDSFTYVKTVVDVVEGPVLILDDSLLVIAANDAFYATFQTELKDTEGKFVYELGNGQWDIPPLRKLLADILPKNAFFKNFEVIHEFPGIGRRIMMLNARKVHIKENTASEVFPPVILLAMEDVTKMIAIAKALAKQIEP